MNFDTNEDNQRYTFAESDDDSMEQIEKSPIDEINDEDALKLSVIDPLKTPEQEALEAKLADER